MAVYNRPIRSISICNTTFCSHNKNGLRKIGVKGQSPACHTQIHMSKLGMEGFDSAAEDIIQIVFRKLEVCMNKLL